MNYRQKNTGFTLIEVVISIGVLAIGLLGLASLQATAMKLANSALLRSQANSLAYNIVDAMLANRAAAVAGRYDHDFANPSDVECAGSVTLSGSIAEQDLQAWENTLACALPQGTGKIVRNVTEFTVTVRWDDSRGKSGTENPLSTVEIETDIGQP